MAEEPKKVASDSGEVSSDEATQDVAAEMAASGEKVPGLPRRSGLASARFALARAAGALEDSLHLIGASKARLSLAVGLFAALVTAIGFTTFDLRRDARMLEQKYPEAVNSDERHVLYARDLIDRREYKEAREILENMTGRPDGSGARADALFLLGRLKGETAVSPRSANAARITLDKFVRDFPTDPRVPAAHRLVAESLARSELYDDSTGMTQSESYAESTTRLKKVLRMISDEREKGEIEFLIARNDYREGRLPAALDALKELRQKYAGAPVAGDAAILAAGALIKYERSKEAEAILQQLLKNAPHAAHSAAALRMLAEIAVDSGDFKQAIEYSLTWLKESRTPRDQLDIMLILALARLETGSPGKALALASQVVKSFPKSPRLAEAIALRGRAHEALGEMDEAETSYLQAVKLEPSVSWPYRALAKFYASIERLPEAIDLMERAGAMAPDEDIMWMELAELYRENGDYTNALSLLRVFTYERHLSPDISRAFMMMVDIQLDTGSLQDAYATLERLVAAGVVATDLPVVYDRQGDILDATGLHDAAIEKYRMAAESGGDVAREKINVARVFLRTGRARECVDELADIDQGSQPTETRFDLLDLRAGAHVELGEYGEARRAIREAMSLRSGREKYSTLASLMRVNLALGDKEAASEIYELTLKLIGDGGASEQAPRDSRRIILEWARDQYDTGEYARAVEAYSRVASPAFPITDVAWALYQRGNCHYHMAEYDKAGELYTRLAAEFADSEWVKFAKAKEQLIGVGSGT